MRIKFDRPFLKMLDWVGPSNKGDTLEGISRIFLYQLREQTFEAHGGMRK